MKTGIVINIEIKYAVPKPAAWANYDISALMSFIEEYVDTAGATMTGGVIVVEEDENED